MKHSIIETAEMIAWLLLGILGGLLMLDAASRSRFIPVDQSAPWMVASVLIGSIIVGAGLYFIISKYLMTWPLWVRIGTGLIGMTVIVYAWAKMSLQGFMFLIGISDAPSAWLIIPGMALMALLYFSLLRHWLRSVTVRINNVVMMAMISGLSAVIAVNLDTPMALVFLVAIAVYDAIAVWKLKSMQKMALSLIDGGIIPGIAVPKREPMEVEGHKIDVALLGFGDLLVIVVVGGALLREGWGFLPVIGMFGAVIWLFIFSEKGKFYPAVPYIGAGCLIGMALSAVI